MNEDALEKSSGVPTNLDKQFSHLKGLSHEIFTVTFWLEWIYLGLNEDHYWFLNFKEGSLILDS